MLLGSSAVLNFKEKCKDSNAMTHTAIIIQQVSGWLHSGHPPMGGFVGGHLLKRRGMHHIQGVGVWWDHV